MSKRQKPIPTLEQLQAGDLTPRLPAKIRSKLWRTINVHLEVTLKEETDHFLNMLCLHFGLHRNNIITHAINLLWNEACKSIPKTHLQQYEEKLEAIRLVRLQKKEAKEKERHLEMDASLAKARKKQRQHQYAGFSVGRLVRYKEPKEVNTERVEKTAINVNGNDDDKF
jgi:hypothetical protein